MAELLSLAVLRAALSGAAAAFRSITTLQPADGEGGKLFPATYSGGKYATEKWRIQIDGQEREVSCVLLNSVQSEANFAELALLDAVRAGKLALPLIEVDFTSANPGFRKDLPNLTSLEVPHRLADAILRDSELADGTRFSKSDFAKQWGRSNLWSATAVYQLCPTALVFGMWGSPEKPGGLGAKFERAYISEIVAVDALPVERRSGFRVDPIAASSKVPVLAKADGTFDVVEKGKLRPSELNHGNIVFDSAVGGVRCRYAQQSTLVSLGALRKLRFPVDGTTSEHRDNAARTVLAALGIAAGVLASERGISLRSRCNLWPTGPRVWELIEKPGAPPREFTITGDQALAVLSQAVNEAEAAGLIWRKDKLVLKPAKELIKLISESQERMAKEGEEEAEAGS